ncbi:hypothetical protein E4U53_003010 [Claviceps sorghi]|nr:hypothetical protein E4U53_003010 [Claviceps sorghi]
MQQKSTAKANPSNDDEEDTRVRRQRLKEAFDDRATQAAYANAKARATSTLVGVMMRNVHSDRRSLCPWPAGGQLSSSRSSLWQLDASRQNQEDTTRVGPRSRGTRIWSLILAQPPLPPRLS